MTTEIERRVKFLAPASWPRGLVALLAGWLSWGALGQAVVVYDNLQNPLATFAALDSHHQPTEFGDEIKLAGTQRIVTSFVFDYNAKFTPSGAETARIRFYLNDGPGIYLTPHTVIFDSGPFAISSGSMRVTIPIAHVEVPNDFTWTVEFGGLSQTPGNLAELVIADPPTVGGVLAGGLVGSYSDYWKYSDGLWTLFEITSGLPANFAARVLAINEPMNMAIARDASTGALVIHWAGDPQETYQVQASDDLEHWITLVTTRPGSDGQIEYTVTPPPGGSWKFYRAAELIVPPQAARLFLHSDPPHRTYLLRWTGDPNLIYQLKYSTDFKTWYYLATVSAGADGVAQYTDVPSAYATNRFYRVWTPW